MLGKPCVAPGSNGVVLLDIHGRADPSDRQDRKHGYYDITYITVAYIVGLFDLTDHVRRSGRSLLDHFLRSAYRTCVKKLLHDLAVLLLLGYNASGVKGVSLFERFSARAERRVIFVVKLCPFTAYMSERGYYLDPRTVTDDAGVGYLTRRDAGCLAGDPRHRPVLRRNSFTRSGSVKAITAAADPFFDYV